MLREREDQWEADKARHVAMLEKMQQSVGQASRDVAAKDGIIRELEERLKRSDGDIADLKKVQVNNDTFIAKELENLKEQVEDLENLKKEQEVTINDLIEQIKQKDVQIVDQQDQILQLCDEKLKDGDGNNKEISKAIDSMKQFNKGSIEKFHQMESHNQELIKQNRELQKQVLQDQIEISNLLDQIKELQAVIDIKDTSIQKLQHHLDLRAKADYGAYSHLVTIKKENQILKDRILNSEGVIASLQSSQEKQKKKILNSASLIDRLKHENEKFRSNYKLTNSYSPRKFDDLPAVISDVGSSGRHLVYPAASDDLPPRARSSSLAKRLTYDDQQEELGPIDLEDAAKARKPVKVKLGAFFKAQSESEVSDRIKVDKQASSFVFKNTGSIDDKVRDRNFKVDCVFSQFTLKGLNNYLDYQMASHKRLIYLIFGVPKNIRLFLVHKITSLLMARLAKSVAAHGNSCQLIIQGERNQIDILQENWTAVQKERGSASKSSIRISQLSDDESTAQFSLHCESLSSLEVLKNSVFKVLTSITAQSIEFLRIYLVASSGETLEDVLLLIKDPVELHETVYTHLRDLLVAFTSTFKTVTFLDDLFLQLDLSSFLTQSFLVSEKEEGQGEDQESHHLRLIGDMQRSLATVKTNEQLYV